MKKAFFIFLIAVMLFPLVFTLNSVIKTVTAYAVEPPIMRVGISLMDDYLVCILGNGDVVTNQSSGATIALMPGTYRLANDGNGIRISDAGGNSHGVFSGPLKLVPGEEGVFKLGNAVYGSTYGGKLEVVALGNKVTAINIIDLESYIRGIVPREMPSAWGNYDGMDALRAQAVASRTYALNCLARGNHITDPFELCDGEHCQVYGGKSGETANTDRVVAETRGQILIWNGKPIEALYHSTNGGYTECAANVWSTPFPYLISQPDPFDVPGNPDLQSHPNAIWQKEIPLSYFSNLLTGGGTLTPVNVKVSAVFPSGRVSELNISGGGTNVSFLKERARTILDLRSQLYTVREQLEASVWIVSANTQGREMKHSFNELEGKWAVSAYGSKGMLTENSYSVLTAGGGGTVPSLAYIIEGRGWGHGIGMSQYGAYNRSRAGHTYAEILSFYYPGTELVNAY